MTSTEKALLKVLIAEDTLVDVQLMVRELEKSGYQVTWRQVENAASLRDALAEETWDVLLSDYNMPGFTAHDVITILHETNAQVPLIIVSGAIGEEVAVDLMKAGAEDYVLKSNLRKLSFAIARSRREHSSRIREQEAQASAAKAIRDREKMLAVVSHDLKNPLGAILLNLKLVGKLLASPARPDREKMLETQLARIQRSADRMSHLIVDVLDMAKIEAGRFVIQKTENDAEELISETLDLFEPMAMQKAVNLKADLPPTVTTGKFDREKIFQVIENLVGNAVKFTPERGSVVISLRAQGERIQFSVRDSGPGIPAEHLPRLFDRFWQAEQTARQGTGLGLSIAKGIVDAHGGEIWVESRLGHGSEFYFSIPNS